MNEKKKHSKEILLTLQEAHDRLDALASIDVDDKVKKECLDPVTSLLHYIFGKAILDRQRTDEFVSFKLPKGIM